MCQALEAKRWIYAVFALQVFKVHGRVRLTDGRMASEMWRWTHAWCWDWLSVQWERGGAPGWLPDSCSVQMGVWVLRHETRKRETVFCLGYDEFEVLLGHPSRDLQKIFSYVREQYELESEDYHVIVGIMNVYRVLSAASNGIITLWWHLLSYILNNQEVGSSRGG